jgi:hypothetical protein
MRLLTCTKVLALSIYLAFEVSTVRGHIGMYAYFYVLTYEYIHILFMVVCMDTYSLRFRIRSRLGQRHGHQSTTLTSLFYQNICWQVIYVRSYESNFQDKFIYMIFTFSNSTT